jgi:Leucine-rich repeat (LRR) protein
MTTTTSTLAALRSGELKGIKRLDLACNLQDFPREVFALADTLEILNPSGNALTAHPDDLSRLSKLRVLFCSGNRFTRLPEVLSSCVQLEMVGFQSNSIREVSAAAISPGLRWLIFTDNQISALPESIGNCTRLQKLMLAGNQLTDLPEAMRGCVGLELLRLSANRFQTLPEWVLHLPRLTWLAFGGNPCSAMPREPSSAVPHLHWEDLVLAEQLGEGCPVSTTYAPANVIDTEQPPQAIRPSMLARLRLRWPSCCLMALRILLIRGLFFYCFAEAFG